MTYASDGNHFQEGAQVMSEPKGCAMPGACAAEHVMVENDRLRKRIAELEKAASAVAVVTDDGDVEVLREHQEWWGPPAFTRATILPRSALEEVRTWASEQALNAMQRAELDHLSDDAGRAEAGAAAEGYGEAMHLVATKLAKLLGEHELDYAEQELASAAAVVADDRDVAVLREWQTRKHERCRMAGVETDSPEPYVTLTWDEQSALSRMRFVDPRDSHAPPTTVAAVVADGGDVGTLRRISTTCEGGWFTLRAHEAAALSRATILPRSALPVDEWRSDAKEADAEARRLDARGDHDGAHQAFEERDTLRRCADELAKLLEKSDAR